MENKKNIIAIIENIRAAKELSVEEKAQFDALTLQDWADLLNDGEKVTDLADKAAKNKTLQIKKEKCAEFLAMDKAVSYTHLSSNTAPRAGTVTGNTRVIRKNVSTVHT